MKQEVFVVRGFLEQLQGEIVYYTDRLMAAEDS